MRNKTKGSPKMRDIKIIKIQDIKTKKVYTLTFNKALGNIFYLMDTNNLIISYFDNITRFYSKFGNYSEKQNFASNGNGSVREYTTTTFKERTTNITHSLYDKIITSKNPEGRLKNRISKFMSRDDFMLLIRTINSRGRKIKVLSENRY